LGIFGWCETPHFSPSLSGEILLSFY